MRQFETGATRNPDTGKPDYEGFLSPRVLEAYGTYMNFNRLQENGERRDSDNWQKGIPSDAYMKSGWRHFFDWWKFHRGMIVHEGIVFALCAIMFNVMGYLDNLLKDNPGYLADNLATETEKRNKRWAEKRGLPSST